MAQIHQLKVSLRSVQLPIWRRIEVASDMSLEWLHHVLQVAMGWRDTHLHRFDTAYGSFGPMDVDQPSSRDEQRATLAKVAPAVGVEYEYDFGDRWVHDIVVEDIRVPARRSPIPAS